MVTYPSIDKSVLFAFEIENIYALPRRVARVLERIEGVTNVRVTLLSGRATDTRVEFNYSGRDYIVYEPFGDNSRYWIGPRDDEDHGTDISALEDAFKRYRPSFFQQVIGDILTLRVLKRLAGRGWSA